MPYGPLPIKVLEHDPFQEREVTVAHAAGMVWLVPEDDENPTVRRFIAGAGLSSPDGDPAVRWWGAQLGWAGLVYPVDVDLCHPVNAHRYTLEVAGQRVGSAIQFIAIAGDQRVETGVALVMAADAPPRVLGETSEQRALGMPDPIQYLRPTEAVARTTSKGIRLHSIQVTRGVAQEMLAEAEDPIEAAFAAGLLQQLDALTGYVQGNHPEGDAHGVLDFLRTVAERLAPLTAHGTRTYALWKALTDLLGPVDISH